VLLQSLRKLSVRFDRHEGIPLQPSDKLIEIIYAIPRKADADNCMCMRACLDPIA